MKPDRALAVIAAFFGLADAGIALACGAPWVAAVLAFAACWAASLFWRVPLRGGQDCGIEALMNATREDRNPDIDLWEQEMSS